MTITISDKSPDSGALSVELAEILDEVGDEARASNWTVREVEAVGDGAQELIDAEDAGTPIDGERLKKLAQNVIQIIDGEFRGFRTQESKPWIIIKAVDSTSWDIASDVTSVLDRFRKKYSSVYEAGDQPW